MPEESLTVRQWCHSASCGTGAFYMPPAEFRHLRVAFDHYKARTGHLYPSWKLICRACLKRREYCSSHTTAEDFYREWGVVGMSDALFLFVKIPRKEGDHATNSD